MTTSLATRLNRLEGRSSERALVTVAASEDEAQELRASAFKEGKARPVVIVGPAPAGPPRCLGNIVDLLAHVAKYGRHIHETRTLN